MAPHQPLGGRFRPYPIRNPILGRESTPGELAFWGRPGRGFNVNRLSQITNFTK